MSRKPSTWKPPPGSTRHIGYPTPGTYVVRLVKHGPAAPLIIWEDGAPPDWLDDPPHVRTLVPGIGFLCHYLACGPARDLLDLWPGTRPITEEEAKFLVADAHWQRDFDPSGPLADPMRPCNPKTADITP